MKIAITQRQLSINGITYDCLEQGWYRLLSAHEIIAVPNLINIDLDVDMLILSGGNSSQDRYKTEMFCCEWAKEKNIPTLGVCHGAFFLNFLYGGMNGDIDGHQNTTHDIIMENSTVEVNSYHHMAIAELGLDLEAIAYSPDGIEGFRHRSLPIWGLVWHPERMLDPVLPIELKELLDV